MPVQVELSAAIARILPQLPVLVWVIDRAGVILEFGGRRHSENPEAQRSPVGRSLTEMLGSDDPLHPVHTAFQQALAGECVYREFDFGRKLRACLGPGHTDGVVTHVVVVAVDVTDAVIAEELFTLYMRYSPAAAFLRDSDGRYRWVNEAYANLYRRKLDELIGHHQAEFDPPELAQRYHEIDAQVLETGSPLRHTLPFEGPDGPGRALGHRFPVPRAGEDTAVGGVYVDITDLVNAQEKAAAGEERYRALFEGAAIAMATIDLNGELEEANTAFCHLFGRLARDMVHRRADDLLTPEDAQRIREHWTEVASGRRTRFQESVTGVTGDGRTFTAKLTLNLARMPDARPWLTIATLEPITAAESAQQRLMLTRTEASVLEALAAGESNSGIAAQLHLSRQAIDYHLANLRRKLAAPSRAAVTARAYALGLLESPGWPPTVLQTRISG